MQLLEFDQPGNLMMLVPISIGIPTYNRPEGLRKALASLAMQTVAPEEIIVSDNAGEDHHASAICAEFADRLPGLKYYRQPENIGANANFIWLLDHASRRYFMWLADDDEYAAPDAVERLHTAISELDSPLLVFPEVDAFFDKARTNWMRNIHSRVFARCKSDWHYLKAFSGYGGGHCFYGLYDRERLLSLDPRALLDPHLAYFNEGRFLHQLFLEGGVRFVPAARFVYDGTSAGKIAPQRLYEAFLEFSQSIRTMYQSSSLGPVRKFITCRNIVRTHNRYIARLKKDVTS